MLARREIEARIVGPIIEAMSHEFGRERVIAVVRETILKLARETGAGLAQHSGGCSLAHFANTLTLWRADDALDIDMIESTQETLSFNVTRCRYAEMYEALGLRELGGILSCSRDYALIEGFNPSVQLTRTQTIMEGATHCDFRFADKSSIAGASSKGNET
ncbi:MAG: L-2-amino-thiazoline-4-carboxylic acid hydrolase [Candidatus Hydrogenedentes bacterium]|nr:L-2-amino-thiazoline-4-carboxylic acid hydrolase [Candidatus Hydrogenedentota bacterium]